MLFFKQLALVGSTMGSMSEMAAAWTLVRDGRVRAVVDAVLPMSRIVEAHGRLEDRRVVGKLVLRGDVS